MKAVEKKKEMNHARPVLKLKKKCVHPLMTYWMTTRMIKPLLVVIAVLTKVL
jgi:hypothetical protein